MSPHDVLEEIRASRGRGELILIVDDEAPILTVTSQTLEAFGYRTLTASGGAEALALYEQHGSTIDAVITDMMMPGMDGRTLIAALRAIDPSVCILAASGLGGGDNAVRAHEEGVAQFLTKPYTAEALVAVLRDVFDEAGEMR